MRLDAERASRATEALVARAEIERLDLFEQVEATRRFTALPAEAREVLASQVRARQAAQDTSSVQQQIQAKDQRIASIEAREAARRNKDAADAVRQMVALQLVPDYDSDALESWRQRFIDDPSLIERTLRFGRSSRF